jgi:hypothetical protein
MSKENVLKKQFVEKDVNRLRNLVKENMQINPQLQSVLQKNKKAHISKEIYGIKKIRRGLLRMALNKMLLSLIKLVKRLTSPFFALAVRKQ